MSENRPPRVTGAHKLNCLHGRLRELLAGWDASSNPVLLSAAGQLRRAMAEADTEAYRLRFDWEQREYDAAVREAGRSVGRR